jgi:hypothetical protein
MATTIKPKTAGELIQMFIEQRGKSDEGTIYLTERQADWFLGLYRPPANDKSYIYGGSYLIQGDLHVSWTRRNRNGSLRIDYYSLSAKHKSEAEQRQRWAEQDAEDRPRIA